MRYLPLWLAQLVGDAQLEADVQRVVRRIEGPVWKRVTGAGTTMSPFEARGYLRARSAMLVAQHVRQELQEDRSPKTQQRLTVAVDNDLTRRIIGRLATIGSETPVIREAA